MAATGMDVQEDDGERVGALLAMCERMAIALPLPHLEEALTHPSFANEQRALLGVVVDNQRLEFLGDSVLGLCVSELLMAEFGSVDEGQLTMMRATLVNTSALAIVARDVGVDRCVRLGRGADATGERTRANVLADALEAIVGCVYLDAGLPAARELVRVLVGEPLAKLVAMGGTERDAKSRLQETLQARGLPTPRYRVVAEQGPGHAREFVVEVEAHIDRDLAQGALAEVAALDGVGRSIITTTGQGRSKKLAEQQAASLAIAIIEGKT
jgi:ribonuclease-3